MPGMVLLGSVDVSPVRKRTDDRGASMSDAPVAQSTVPLTPAESLLMTQTLVGVLPGFGTGSGAPKKQPASVHVLMVPVSAEVAGPIVATFASHDAMAETAELRSGRSYGSGTELPPPPV